MAEALLALRWMTGHAAVLGILALGMRVGYMVVNLDRVAAAKDDRRAGGAIA